MHRNGVYILMLSILTLIALGLVMLMSVGAFAPANQGNPTYFISRQGIFLLIGIIGCTVAARWDYHHWTKYAWILVAISLLLMAACFLPGIGVKVKGAHRWVDVGFTNIQPVEVAKLSVIALLAMWMGMKQKTIQTFRDGVAIPIAVLCCLAVLCVFQRDLGTAALMLVITTLMMFIAGTKLLYLTPLPVAGVAGILAVAFHDPEKLERLLAFMNPEKYQQDGGYQIWMALIAFGSGGVSGLGLGNGVQKMFYLPEAHTDCIFPIVGEELGLTFTLLVVFCFLLLALSGGWISCHAPDTTGLLLGFGVTALICLQAAMNMAVVTSLIPAKGIGLPFISYGGSNLLMCLACVGILLNIHGQAIYSQKKKRGVLPSMLNERM
ncbi:MAG: putative lipid II flippase FtsW [Blastochloris sp.]|nr:putative lipid II flippase FtsW [Blastochloris sp.]